VSFWFNHSIDRADLLCITELYYAGEKEAEWADQYDLKESTEIVGQWLRAEMNFSITEEVDSVKVFVIGNGSRKPYIVDDLLVRKTAGPDLFGSTKIGATNYIIYNNFWLKENSFQSK
jgi:hypothetical protein